MHEPRGLYRHHKSCQLGKLDNDNNCPRPALPGKHWGIRICRHHMKLVKAIAADGKKSQRGSQRRKPVTKPAQQRRAA